VVTIEVEHVPVEALAWLAERVPVRPSPGWSPSPRTGGPRSSCCPASASPWPRSPRPTSSRSGSRPGRSSSGAPVGSTVGGRCGWTRVPPPRRSPPRPGSWVRRASPRASWPSTGRSPSSPLGGSTSDGRLPARGEPPRRASSARPSRRPGHPAALEQAAADLIRLVADELGHVGVLCLGLFQVDGALFANELAPESTTPATGRSRRRRPASSSSTCGRCVACPSAIRRSARPARWST
jgi:5-(carboxyamino)imidazole ribonucleotide synthase